MTTLGNDLDTVGTTLTDEASYNFTLAFASGNSEVAQPQVPATFQVVLQNTGSQTTTYNVSLSALPAGVTGSLSTSSVTLGPGQSTGSGGIPALTATLTSTSTTALAPFNFMVTATAQGARRSPSRSPGRSRRAPRSCRSSRSRPTRPSPTPAALSMSRPRS